MVYSRKQSFDDARSRFADWGRPVDRDHAVAIPVENYFVWLCVCQNPGDCFQPSSAPPGLITVAGEGHANIGIAIVDPTPDHLPTDPAVYRAVNVRLHIEGDHVSWKSPHSRLPKCCDLAVVPSPKSHDLGLGERDAKFHCNCESEEIEWIRCEVLCDDISKRNGDCDVCD